MNQYLKDKYGYAVVPKNTLLYRGHKSEAVSDCMFFALKHYVASAFNKQVQIWKTSQDIEVLFLVDYINERSWTFSALPRLYNELFPEDNNSTYSDLDIKHWNIERRDKLVKKLHNEHQVNGWLTSVENHHELEICLFGEQTCSQTIKFIDVFNDGNKYYKDSLRHIDVFPTASFFETSYEEIRSNNYYNVDKIEMFRKYKRIINYNIREESRTDDERKKNREWWSNLRLKLKI